VLIINTQKIVSWQRYSLKENLKIIGAMYQKLYKF